MSPLAKAVRLISVRVIAVALCAASVAFLSPYGAAQAGDMSLVPLFDGERSDALNLWGGPFTNGNILGVTKQSTVVRSGSSAYQANLGVVENNGFRFFQTFSSQLTGEMHRRQDRDLTQYQSLEGYVRNDASVPLTFSLEIKDYRDSNSHRARRSYTVPVGEWTRIEAPLDLSAGWNVSGSPDLTRTYAVGFLVDADFGSANGSLYLDDFSLRENGPSVDAAAAPIENVVERLARRQFMGLWQARNKTSGLIPNSSDNVAIGALNTTTGVVWTLPAAIRRGWVTQGAADDYMTKLVTSLNANRNQTTYLPTRFLDLLTAAPVTDREESTIDASFIFLALHNYRSQSSTPVELRDAIATLEDRFNFAAFAGSGAYRMAYFPTGGGITSGAYAGYTNENKVITLAGAISDAHYVPLETMWNKDVGRTLASLVDPADRFLTYSFDTQYRAPFVQALLNLFVDTSDRGVDDYPTRSMARNPWINFVRYQNEVADKLAQLGRENFVQPDAGQGAAGYQPYNLFNNFGQPNLFMPWSVAFALMADAANSEAALRFLLDNGLGGGLDGPLGLADSAQWVAGADNPTQVPSFADNWNITLSLMALMEYLEGPQRASLFFANLPEVKSELDTVYLDGDLNGDGVTNGADLAIWQNGFGATGFASPANGDADGDGDVDGADFLRWQRGVGISTYVAATRAVPEPLSAALLAVGWASIFATRLPSRRRTTASTVDRVNRRKAIESACKECCSQYNR